AAGHVRQGYTMQEVIDVLANEPAAMQCARQALKGKSAALADVKLLAPIENPPSLWCAAANYKDHQAEMKAASGGPDRADFTKDDLMAEFFLKPSSSIIGPGGAIVLPRIAKHVDYECELCVVIGKKARHVSEAQALDYVFGYTLCWDISQREPWGRNRQNTRNIRKGFDTFTALGPLDRDARRAGRAAGHAHPRRAERKARDDRAHARHDLRRARPHPLPERSSHAPTRRSHHHRHAGRRRQARAGR